jgi:hypothetical protein
VSIFDDTTDETTNPGLDAATQEALESLTRVQKQALQRASGLEHLAVRKKSLPRMPKVVPK